MAPCAIALEVSCQMCAICKLRPAQGMLGNDRQDATPPSVEKVPH